jgi:hypothetical protein
MNLARGEIDFYWPFLIETDLRLRTDNNNDKRAELAASVFPHPLAHRVLPHRKPPTVHGQLLSRRWRLSRAAWYERPIRPLLETRRSTLIPSPQRVTHPVLTRRGKAICLAHLSRRHPATSTLLLRADNRCVRAVIPRSLNRRRHHTYRRPLRCAWVEPRATRAQVDADRRDTHWYWGYPRVFPLFHRSTLRGFRPAPMPRNSSRRNGGRLSPSTKNGRSAGVGPVDPPTIRLAV